MCLRHHAYANRFRSSLRVQLPLQLNNTTPTPKKQKLPATNKPKTQPPRRNNHQHATQGHTKSNHHGKPAELQAQCICCTRVITTSRLGHHTTAGSQPVSACSPLRRHPFAPSGVFPSPVHPFLVLITPYFALPFSLTGTVKWRANLQTINNCLPIFLGILCCRFADRFQTTTDFSGDFTRLDSLVFFYGEQDKSVRLKEKFWDSDAANPCGSKKRHF